MPALGAGPAPEARVETRAERTSPARARPGGRLRRWRSLSQGLGRKAWRAIYRAPRELSRKFVDRDRVLADQAADPHLKSVMAHSERDGRYVIVSDLHWGLGRQRRGPQDRTADANNGPFHAQEDSRRGDVFAKMVDRASRQPKNTTMVIAGDWIDLMEHVNEDSSMEQVKRAVDTICQGHAQEIKAMADAIVNRGMRVIYVRGNHDIHLVDPRVRKMLIGAMAETAGLDGEQRELLEKRVAWSGHAALLGARGEGIVLHGDGHDAFNTWRSRVNPYDGNRNLQSNFGWEVVKVYRLTERDDPLADNTLRSTGKLMLKRLKTWTKLPRFLWRVLSGPASGALREAELADDRLAMRYWVERSGFADKMNDPIAGAPGEAQGIDGWARTMEGIYAKAPRAMRERMTSRFPLLNLAKMLIPFVGGVSKLRREVENADSKMLSELVKLPNVRFVGWGHSHKEAAALGEAAKGPLEHFNSGSWTKVHGEWKLNVVLGETDGDGRLSMSGLFRTNPVTGEPNLPHEASSRGHELIDGWNQRLLDVMR